MNHLIAIPSKAPGGMEAAMGDHFGHCDLYTLVRVDAGRVAGVEVIPNFPHQQGGCLAPVHHLAQKGVTRMIAGGMGMGPLRGFGQKGIDVYFSNGVSTVAQAVDAMLEGRLPQFGTENTCKGGCSGH